MSLRSYGGEKFSDALVVVFNVSFHSCDEVGLILHRLVSLLQLRVQLRHGRVRDAEMAMKGVTEQRGTG